MFKKFSLAALVASSLLVTGCATQLSPGQKREYNAYQEKGFDEREKSVALASTLGIFPVAGYAYVGHPGLAITSIITWPFLGFLWMPFDTGGAAQNRNYFATKELVEREKRKALIEIDQKLEDKEYTYEQHLREQRIIEAKYSPY